PNLGTPFSRSHHRKTTLGDPIDRFECLLKNLEANQARTGIVHTIANGFGSWLGREFVTEAVDGLDELWMFWIFFELLSQPCNVNIDRSRRRHGIISPNSVEQLVA